MSDNEYLFESYRQRRAGLESRHIDESLITLTYSLLQGNQCTPHDMRRAFGTTFAREFGLKLDEIKTSLDHSEGVRSGDVTATHYAFLDGDHEKWRIMQGWCDWIEAQTVKAKAD